MNFKQNWYKVAIFNNLWFKSFNLANFAVVTSFQFSLIFTVDFSNSAKYLKERYFKNVKIKCMFTYLVVNNDTSKFDYNSTKVTRMFRLV